VLAFVGLAAVLCPLADAAISRRAESPPTASPPTTASRGSWPPHFTHCMTATVRPADGRSGCWHPIRPPTSESALLAAAADPRA
jgi:hypothetical protein